MEKHIHLPWQGQDTFFRSAYLYNRAQILAFLQAAVDRAPDETKATLSNLLQGIHWVRTGGEYYRWPTPESHNLRELNPDWTPKDQEALENGNPPLERARVRLDKRWVTSGGIPYWNVYDMLGEFLGLLGGAPSGANEKNFFLPMLAVYGQWCFWLAGWPNGTMQRLDPYNRIAISGVDNWPQVFSIVWDTQRINNGKDIIKPFTLGASLSGQGMWKSEKNGNFARTIQYERMALMNHPESPINFAGHRYRFGQSPLAKQYTGGLEWGNCAETYPFLQLIHSDNQTQNEELRGITIKREFIRAQTYDDYATDIASQFEPACTNCGKIIEWVGGRPSNFRKHI